MMNNIFTQIQVPSSLNSFSAEISKIIVSLKNKIGVINKKTSSIVNSISNSKHAFVCDNFSYISYVKIKGLGLDGTPEMINKMQHNLNLHLREYIKSGHEIHYCFASYQDNVIEQLKSVQRGRDKAAERLGLNTRENDEAQIKHIRNNAFFEEQLVILVTPKRNSILQSSVVDLADKQPDIPLSDKYKLSTSQGDGDKLLNPHNLFVESFMQFCTNKEVMIDAELLEHEDALASIMAFTDSKTAKTSTAQKIEPNFFVNKEFKRPDLELFDAYFAKDFDSALFKDLPKLHPRNDSVVTVGDRHYMSIIMDAYSSEFLSFNALHRKLCVKRIPYLCKTSVGGDPLRSLNMQYTASKLGGIGPQRRFNELYNSLIDYSYDETPTFVQQIFTTWVDGEENLKQLRIQAEDLRRELVAWTQREANKCHIDNVTPRETLLSVMPSSVRSVGTKIPLPLNDVSNRLPLFRPSFPWSEDGDFISTSPDGKVMPISFQNGRVAKVTYITGSMGAGKTALLSWMRNNLILHRDSNHIPYQINLDVDNSIRVDTELYAIESEIIRDKVVHIPINNNPAKKDSIYLNILDTPPGMRLLPTGLKTQISSAIADRLAGPSNDDIKNVDGMVTDLLDKTYNRLAQPGSAKKIRISDVPSLRPKLHALGFPFQSDTEDMGFSEESLYVGWDIVDFLMLNGEFDLAIKVQAKCVPVLTDVLAEANKSEWQKANSLKDAVEGRGKLVADALQNMIRSYPFVAHESNFSIWNKHIITFELGKVIEKSSNPSSVYKSRFWFNLVFIYIRAILMLSIEDIQPYLESIESDTSNRTFKAKEVTEAISAYHRAKIQDVATAVKRGCIDEFHRYLGTGAAPDPTAEANLNTFLNEIRRSGVELCFASPLPEHGRLFKDMASMVIILGFNTSGALRQCEDVFGLSEYETQNYVRPLRLNPPKGINAYLIINNVSEISNINEFRHVVYFPIPPNFIWRCANRNIEKMIRHLVIEKFNYQRGMILLAGALPGAGTSKEIERIKRSMAQEGLFDELNYDEQDDAEKADSMLAENIFQKIVADYDYYMSEGKRLLYLDDRER
jgi:hypothetical protein